ncbi:MAG: restriction endonuclease [Candidatus Woesearchaeota archaeon]
MDIEDLRKYRAKSFLILLAIFIFYPLFGFFLALIILGIGLNPPEAVLIFTYEYWQLYLFVCIFIIFYKDLSNMFIQSKSYVRNSSDYLRINREDDESRNIILEENLEGNSFEYSSGDFIEFREFYFKYFQKKGIGFNSGNWFIKHYSDNEKILKKHLKMYLDLQLELLPDSDDDIESEEQDYNYDFVLEKLNESFELEIEENADLIIKKNKVKLLENFVKRNNHVNFLDDTNEDIDMLETVLDNNDIPIIYTELNAILYNVKVKSELDKFKSKLPKSKNITLNQVVETFLEFYGDNYQNYLPVISLELFSRGLLKQVDNLKHTILDIKEKLEVKNYEKRLMKDEYMVADYENLNGGEFEEYLERLFVSLGYKVKRTKLSGDQGADLVIEKFKERTVVQAKKYTKPVTNKAIQEVVASKRHYKCEKAIVVTTSTFTKSAKELAKSNQVELWDNEMLRKKVSN